MATLPAAKSNLQKFFHQKSAVSINILKIAGTAIAKHIDRTLAHRHTHTQGDMRRLLLLVASWAVCLPGLLHSPAAAYDLWMHVLIYAMCQPGLVPIPHSRTSLSIILCTPASFLSCIVSAENYATIFLLCLGNFVHCWLIHSHSKQKANVWAITHMHTHTLPLILPVFPSLALPVISAGKSKHFKLSILRVTCGINSARAYECSKVSWRVEGGSWGASIWFSSGNVVCEKDGKFRIQHKSHCQLCVWQIQKFLLGNMRYLASFVVH